MERCNTNNNNAPPPTTSPDTATPPAPTNTTTNITSPSNNTTNNSSNNNNSNNTSNSVNCLSNKMHLNLNSNCNSNLSLNMNNNTNHSNNKKDNIIRSTRASSSIDSTSTSSTTSSFRKSYPSCSDINTSFSSASGSIIQDELTNSSMNSMNQCGLTQAGLEEYSRSMYHSMYHHQKQSSYAQSEGYHSYVSSTDSSSTPFLDRLRQDSGLLLSRATNWSSQDIPTSTSSLADNNSSESTSSTETLKWHGSLSDVSVASHATSSSAVSASASQLIAHSARVRTPQRHNSESVLYLNEEQQQLIQQQQLLQQQQQPNSNSSSPTSTVDDLRSNKSSPDTTRDERSSRSNSRLFPINTYTEIPVTPPTPTPIVVSIATTPSLTASPLDQSSAKLLNGHNWQSVAERISELEKQNSSNNKINQNFKLQQQQQQKYTFLDPSKTHRVSNPTLKQLQKNAVQSYFERQQQQSVKENNNGINVNSSNIIINNPTNDSINNGIRQNLNSNTIQQSTNSCANNNNKNRPQSLNLCSTINNSNTSIKLSSQRSSMSSYGSNCSIDAKQLQQPAPSFSPSQQPLSIINNNNNNISISNTPTTPSSPNNISNNINNLNLMNNNKTSPTSHNINNGNRTSPQQQIHTQQQQQQHNNLSPNGNYGSLKKKLHKGEKYQQKQVKQADNSSTPMMYERGYSMNGGQQMPPPPPPRNRQSMPLRRTSSAAEYSSIRDKMLQTRQHLSKDLLGPMIMGPIISVDDWVPERPPKNPTLRIPSPELPPPPPPLALVLNIESDDDVMLSTNQDEPLPPPPPEILHHMHQQSRSGDLSPKQIAANSPASRRNSFAGQTANRKQLQQQSSQYRFENKKHLSPSPPALPKKPQSLELLHNIKRPSSSMSATNTKDSILQQQANTYMHQAQQNPVAHNHTHIVQAHRVMLNGNGNPEVPSKLLHHNNNNKSSSSSSISNNSNNNMNRLHNDHPHHHRMSLRKRSHNSHVPLQELTLKSALLLSPPPLKPRIPIMTDMNNSSIGSKLRSNSKASYLPRQPTRDKLSNDPDRGSYKLTLTSNEDSINHNVYPDEILSAKCNLPDVLPVGVKYQNTRYPAMNTNSHTNYNNSQPPTPKSAQTAPANISSNQSKSIFHFPIGSSNYNPNSHHQHPHNPSFSHSHTNLSHHQKVSPTNGPPVFHQQAQPQQPSPQYPTYNSSSLVNSKSKSCSNDAISPKYQSQSTFDLKKTQIIESQLFTNNEDIFKEQHAEQKELETPFEYCVMNMSSQSGLQPFTSNGGCADVEEDDCEDDNDDNVELQQQQQPATINKSEIAKKLNFEKIESTTIVNNNHINSSNIIINNNNSRDTTKEVNQNNSPISVNCSNNNSNNNKNINSLLNVEKDVVMTCTTGSQTTTPTKDQQYVKNYNSCNNNSVVAETEATPEMMSDIDAEQQQTSSVTNAISIEPTAATTNNSNCDTDSLKLMQRSELVLRLNASTAETACQTDESIAVMVQGIETLSIVEPQIVFSARQKTPEEVDCEILAQDLVSQLSTTDKLHNVLAPKTFKTSADYVSDLYKVHIKSRPTKRVLPQSTTATAPTVSATTVVETSVAEQGPSQSSNTSGSTNNSPLEPNSQYFSISESKAKLMTRYNREMTLINGDCSDLTKKKEELVARLGKKLIVLANEQATITEESAANDVLGNEVSIKVAQTIKPSDASKFRSYIDDVGYITMLLLSLSGRLARMENALHYIVENEGDKKILEVKRDRLREQLTEAKQLKDDIDRRGAIISKILEKSLNNDEFGDYEYFINMKAKLIVDSREIADKIKMGEDQLIALKETIVHSEC